MTIQSDLLLLANPNKALDLLRFFKTKKGQYGEGDRFLGIMVPMQRKIVKKYRHAVTIDDIGQLLHSRIHEYRLVGLLLLVELCKKATEKEFTDYVAFYLSNSRYVNNWDLVDLSARDVVGRYLLDKPKERPMLIKLARSNLLWDRRISVVATFAFIKYSDFDYSLRIAELLLQDTHDLIHKAVGWMLREIGKKDETVLEIFLQKHFRTMPRTMLRYAIERLPETRRRYYMGK